MADDLEVGDRQGDIPVIRRELEKGGLRGGRPLRTHLDGQFEDPAGFEDRRQRGLIDLAAGAAAVDAADADGLPAVVADHQAQGHRRGVGPIPGAPLAERRRQTRHRIARGRDATASGQPPREGRQHWQDPTPPARPQQDGQGDHGQDGQPDAPPVTRGSPIQFGQFVGVDVRQGGRPRGLGQSVAQPRLEAVERQSLGFGTQGHDPAHARDPLDLAQMLESDRARPLPESGHLEPAAMDLRSLQEYRIVVVSREGAREVLEEEAGGIPFRGDECPHRGRACPGQVHLGPDGLVIRRDRNRPCEPGQVSDRRVVGDLEAMAAPAGVGPLVDLHLGGDATPLRSIMRRHDAGVVRQPLREVLPAPPMEGTSRLPETRRLPGAQPNLDPPPVPVITIGVPNPIPSVTRQEDWGLQRLDLGHIVLREVTLARLHLLPGPGQAGHLQDILRGGVMIVLGGPVAGPLALDLVGRCRIFRERYGPARPEVAILRRYGSRRIVEINFHVERRVIYQEGIERPGLPHKQDREER